MTSQVLEQDLEVGGNSQQCHEPVSVRDVAVRLSRVLTKTMASIMPRCGKDDNGDDDEHTAADCDDGGDTAIDH